MTQSNQWTAELHSYADMNLHPQDGSAWCAVTPRSRPTAKPTQGFVGCKLPDGRTAFPFMDRAAALEVATTENEGRAS